MRSVRERTVGRRSHRGSSSPVQSHVGAVRLSDTELFVRRRLPALRETVLRRGRSPRSRLRLPEGTTRRAQRSLGFVLRPVSRSRRSRDFATRRRSGELAHLGVEAQELYRGERDLGVLVERLRSEARVHEDVVSRLLERLLADELDLNDLRAVRDALTPPELASRPGAPGRLRTGLRSQPQEYGKPAARAREPLLEWTER